jgi:hypothetical protein
MASLAVLQREIDASIFSEIGEVLRFGSLEASGILHKAYREIEFPSGYVVGLAISFDCTWSDWMGSLTEGDEVSVYGLDASQTEVALGSFRFIRRIPPDGDESSLVILELGSLGA